MLALALTIACTPDQGFSEVDDNGGGGGPQIEITPEVVDFGRALRDEELVQTFVIRSVGTADLQVTGIEMAREDSGFTVLSETSFMLPPGAEQEIEVSFVPMGADVQTVDAIVSSNDEDTKKATVELRGEGSVPELQIDPSPYDFGNTYIGCAKDSLFTLSNVGTDVLDVTAITLDGDAVFTLESGVGLPLTLEPGASTTVTVVFDPENDITSTSELVVESTEPLGVRVASIKGAGKYTAEYGDEFNVPKNPPSDIIMLVDQSCSMDDDQARLASNFKTFISSLSAYTSDWKVMVVNDDDGCNNSGILTPSTADYEKKFSNAVSSGGGSYTEALLTPAVAAVNKGWSTGCNAGFLRKDAQLHIIMVSDEPEQSQWISGKDWKTLVNELYTARGSTAYVKLSAIVGDYPGGCSTADAGTGYYEAVSYTGGEFLSICATSWSSYMSKLAKASVNQSVFELSATPVESSIKVKVNGKERTSGWSYDAATNSVVIETDVPVGGDKVVVTYGGLASCD